VGIKNATAHVAEEIGTSIQRETGWWFGTMEFYDFPYIGNVIIPTDFHSIIFQRGREKPPTRKALIR